MAFRTVALSCSAALSALVSIEALADQTAYVTRTTGPVYSFPLSNPSAAAPTGASVPGGVDIAIYNGVAYVATYSANKVYSFPLNNPSAAAPFASVPNAQGLAITNGIAYVTDSNDGLVYSVPLNNPSAAASLGISIPHATDIAITNGIAYVTTSSSNLIYSFPLNNPSAVATTGASVPYGEGIAISNGIAYVSSNNTGYVYSFPLNNPAACAATAAMVPNAEGIAIANGVAYVLDASNGKVYSFPLSNPSTCAAISGVTIPNAGGIAIYSILSTTDVTGNLKILSDYLNAEENDLEPQSQGYLALCALSGSKFKHALQQLLPNGHVQYCAARDLTFASQTLSQHQSNCRGFAASFVSRQDTSSLHRKGRLFASTSNRLLSQAYPDETEFGEIEFGEGEPDETEFGEIERAKIEPVHTTTASSCCSSWAPWISFFGQVAYEQAYKQTPQFQSTVEGVLIGVDLFNDTLQCCGIDYLGAGLSYVHDHMHEWIGNASLNEGLAVLYSAFSWCHCYSDVAIWGAYAHIDTRRNLNFTGFIAKATSDSHNWLLQPHLELGYDYDLSCWCLVEPFGMVDWVSNWQGSITQHGADGLSMNQPSDWSSLLRSELGVRFNETFMFCSGQLILREKVSLINLTQFGMGATTAFIPGAISDFTVDTLRGNNNLGAVQVELIFNPTKERIPEISFSYEGEFGSAAQTHQFVLTFGKSF